MYKYFFLVLLFLFAGLLLLSSCFRVAPEVTTKSETEATTTTLQPPGGKPFPTEILSPNDSLELVTVTPTSGTILRKGTQVPFKITINYKLSSVKSAFVRADLGIESGKAIGIARLPANSGGQGGIEIQEGSGTLEIEDIVDMRFLAQMVPSDKVYLILSLYYFKSETRMLIVYRVLKDHYFITETSSY